MEAELREHFPSYLHEDFGEFVHADLNDIVKPIIVSHKTQGSSGKVSEVITQDDYRLICNSFMGTIVNMTSCYYHKRRDAAVVGGSGPALDMGLTAVDRRASFALKAEIFRRLFDQFKSTLSDTMDDAFYQGSAAMVETIQKYYEETPVSGGWEWHGVLISATEGNLIRLIRLIPGKTYDFYKDSNVQEVVSCLDALHEVRGRVQRELVHWPDHAVLNDVS